MPFSGQVALVTGASRGLGQAIAVALAGAGAHVVLSARTSGGLEATEAAIHEAGGTATIAPLDLTAGDLLDQLAGAIVTRWGRLDILVLNAASLGSLTPLGHVEPADFDRVMATNVTANYRLLRACDLALRRSPAGRVVALTSSVALRPRAYWGPYAASKAALESLVGSYADEVADISPVRCLIVDPRATRTKMRSAAFPGEDPESVAAPSSKAAQIVSALAAPLAGCSRIVLS